MVKVTFTLDDVTVARLRRAAARLGRPQSQVVREAIRDYAARIGRLSEAERLRLLQVFDTVVPAIPDRPLHAVQAELRAIRRARRRGGRRTLPAEPPWSTSTRRSSSTP
jgi:hypothetical protein